MTPAESLDRWGTVAFSHEVMERTIVLGLPGTRQIECGAWIALIPDRYRWDAITAVNDVMARMLESDRTPMMDEETRNEFISRLSTEVTYIPRWLT